MTLRIAHTRAVESRAVARYLGRKLTEEVDSSVVVQAYPSRSHVLKALIQQEADIAPDYAASLLADLQDTATRAPGVDGVLAELRSTVTALGLLVTEPSTATDVPALVMKSARATALGIATVQDIAARARKLRFGAPARLPGTVWPELGLAEAPRFRDWTDLDTGGPLTQIALRRDSVDVAFSYSSDPGLRATDLRAFTASDADAPADHLVALVRSEAATPQLLDALTESLRGLTTATLIATNATLSPR